MSPSSGDNQLLANITIPYGRQLIDEDDINAVVEVLQSDYLTTGPKVAEFEQAVALYSGAKHAVAVSSGTAALHCVMSALGIRPGDEVIIPPMSFVATANCIVFQGGKPIFADIDPDTLLIDPQKVEDKVTPKTKAIIAVDYAGQPCDYDSLRTICNKHGLALVADACHSFGAEYKGRKAGSLADLTVFSFHPVKHITTGEGGMIATENFELAERMRSFRNHGISADHQQRQCKGTWYYEMTDLGFNYRISDIQCALGLSQLKKIDTWLERRKAIALQYDSNLSQMAGVQLLHRKDEVQHAYHLYVIQLATSAVRERIFNSMRNNGIGTNVHYYPIHLHPFYRKKYIAEPVSCPHAEAAYQTIISLPMHHGLASDDVEKIINILKDAL